MFVLDTICLEDKVLNFVPLHKLVKIGAASTAVLQISYLHFVLDFGHVRSLFGHWLQTWHALLTLTITLIPVDVGFQDGPFLCLFKEVGRAHSHALDIATQVNEELAQQVARVLNHPLLLLFFCRSDYRLILFPILISKESASFASKPRLLGDANTSSMVHDDEL